MIFFDISTKTMKAIVCDAPGPISVLELKEVPIPTPTPDQVLIKIAAFGINRAGTSATPTMNPMPN